MVDFKQVHIDSKPISVQCSSHIETSHWKHLFEMGQGKALNIDLDYTATTLVYISRFHVDHSQYPVCIYLLKVNNRSTDSTCFRHSSKGIIIS